MYVLATFIKYAIAFFVIGMILKFAGKSYWVQKNFIIHPWTLLLVPFLLIGLLVATYIIVPDCSLAFILFLTGYMIFSTCGIDPNEPVVLQSAFVRKYGNTANLLSNIIMVVSLLWGIANFF